MKEITFTFPLLFCKRFICLNLKLPSLSWIYLESRSESFDPECETIQVFLLGKFYAFVVFLLPWWTTHSKACLHFPPWGCLRDGAQFREADSNFALLFTERNESSSAGRAGLRESRRQPHGHVRKSRAPTFAPSASIVRPFSASRRGKISPFPPSSCLTVSKYLACKRNA